MSDQSAPKKSEINWGLIAKILVIVLVVILLAANSTEVEINLLVGKVSLRLWLELLIAFILGAFFGRDVWNWFISKFRKPSA